MNNKMSIFLKSAGFTIPVLLFVVVFLIIYYKKKTDKAEDKWLYTFLLNTIPTPLLLELISLAIAIFMPDTVANKQAITYVMYRIYFVLTFFWFFIFCYYQVLFVFKNLLNNKDTTKSKKIVEYSRKALGTEGRKQRIVAYSIAIVQALLFGIIGKFSIDYLPEVVVLSGRLPMILSASFFTFSMAFYTTLIFFRKKIKGLNITPFFVIMGYHITASAVAVLFGWYTNHIVSLFGFLMTIIYFTTESQDTEILETYNITKENERKSTASKQKILINMSHEVRSPMHNILGYGNIITSEDNMTEEEFKSNMQNITNSVYDLYDMIENIHDISNVESEQISVNQVQYEAKELYKKINKFGIRKSDKGELRFTFELDQMLPNVLYGDHEKIYKIITKILENSINKTNYGEIKLNIAGKMLDTEFIELVYTISNTGHVMTHEMFNMSYEDFMLSEENIDYIKLGVIIAKKYIELLGGEIEFINEKGQGTKYIVKIRQKVIGTAPVGSLVQE